MKDALVIELAATWELQAETGGDGLNRLQPAARETLRACADTLRMLVEATPADDVKRFSELLCETAKETLAKPGEAVPIPAEVTGEFRKLMSGEPSMFDRIAFDGRDTKLPDRLDFYAGNETPGSPAQRDLYAAAALLRATPAAPVVQQPLTDEQILIIGRRALDKCFGTEAQILYVGREVERAHGIAALSPQQAGTQETKP